MNTQLIQKMRELRWASKRLAQASIFGAHRSKAKGSGLEFEQLHDYQMGDDVRAIDWNSSARMNRLLVKQFIESRQQTIMLAIDISASMFYVSSDSSKYEQSCQIAALICYAAFFHNDEIGLILFDEEVVSYIPPRKGKAALQIILDKIFSLTAGTKKTNVQQVIHKIGQLCKKNTVVFTISDFIDDKLNGIIIPRKIDMYAIRILDMLEQQIPIQARLPIKDIETQAETIINTYDKKLTQFLSTRSYDQNTFFIKHRIKMLDIKRNIPLCDQLINFFNSDR